MSAAEDASLDGRGGQSERGGGDGYMDQGSPSTVPGTPQNEPQTSDVLITAVPTSQLVEPGQPKPGFGMIESVYGQKSHEHSDEDVIRSFGARWLTLFRQWRVEAIHSKLGHLFDMDRERASDVPAVNVPHNVGPMGLRVPIQVVRAVFQRWSAGAIADGTIVEIYGEQWLRMFRLRGGSLQGSLCWSGGLDW